MAQAVAVPMAPMLPPTTAEGAPAHKDTLQVPATTTTAQRLDSFVAWVAMFPGDRCAAVRTAADLRDGSVLASIMTALFPARATLQLSRCSRNANQTHAVAALMGILMEIMAGFCATELGVRATALALPTTAAVADPADETALARLLQALITVAALAPESARYQRTWLKLEQRHRVVIHAAMTETVAAMNVPDVRLPGFDQEIELESNLARVPSLRKGAQPVSALRKNLAGILPFAQSLEKAGVATVAVERGNALNADLKARLESQLGGTRSITPPAMPHAQPAQTSATTATATGNTAGSAPPTSAMAGVPPPPPMPTAMAGVPPPPPMPASISGVPPPPPMPASMAGVPPPPPMPASMAGVPPPPPMPSAMGNVPQARPAPPLAATNSIPPPPPMRSATSSVPPPPLMPAAQAVAPTVDMSSARGNLAALLAGRTGAAQPQPQPQPAASVPTPPSTAKPPLVQSSLIRKPPALATAQAGIPPPPPGPPPVLTTSATAIAQANGAAAAAAVPPPPPPGPPPLLSNLAARTGLSLDASVPPVMAPPAPPLPSTSTTAGVPVPPPPPPMPSTAAIPVARAAARPSKPCAQPQQPATAPFRISPSIIGRALAGNAEGGNKQRRRAPGPPPGSEPSRSQRGSQVDDASDSESETSKPVVPAAASTATRLCTVTSPSVTTSASQADSHAACKPMTPSLTKRDKSVDELKALLSGSGGLFGDGGPQKPLVAPQQRRNTRAMSPPPPIPTAASAVAAPFAVPDHSQAAPLQAVEAAGSLPDPTLRLRLAQAEAERKRAAEALEEREREMEAMRERMRDLEYKAQVMEQHILWQAAGGRATTLKKLPRASLPGASTADSTDDEPFYDTMSGLVGASANLASSVTEEVVYDMPLPQQPVTASDSSVATATATENVVYDMPSAPADASSSSVTATGRVYCEATSSPTPNRRAPGPPFNAPAVKQQHAARRTAGETEEEVLYDSVPLNLFESEAAATTLTAIARGYLARLHVARCRAQTRQTARNVESFLQVVERTSQTGFFLVSECCRQDRANNSKMIKTLRRAVKQRRKEVKAEAKAEAKEAKAASRRGTPENVLTSGRERASSLGSSLETSPPRIRPRTSTETPTTLSSFQTRQTVASSDSSGSQVVSRSSSASSASVHSGELPRRRHEHTPAAAPTTAASSLSAADKLVSISPVNTHGRRAAIAWYTEAERPRGNGLLPDKRSPAPWFHGLISREEAEAALLYKTDGTFLVRVSESRFCYVITLRTAQRCRHYMVEQNAAGQYGLLGREEGGVRFLREPLHTRLADLVACFTRHRINATQRLGAPCPRAEDSQVQLLLQQCQTTSGLGVSKKGGYSPSIRIDRPRTSNSAV